MTKIWHVVVVMWFTSDDTTMTTHCMETEAVMSINQSINQSLYIGTSKQITTAITEACHVILTASVTSLTDRQ